MHKAIPNAFENGQRMANVRLIPARLRPLAVLLWLLIPQVYAQPANSSFEFDDSMLVGSAKEQKNITRFNQANAIEPGTYQVDIFINGNFLSRQSLVFAAGEQGVVAACLSRENMVDAGILATAIKAKADDTSSCLNLEQQVEGASSRFDFARLRLDLFVPQTLMQREARGSVSTKDLAVGETVAFANYDTNYYRTQASGNTTESTYLGLNSGLNLGLWQFRQQSTFTRYNSSLSPSNSQWNSVRNYVQRPLPSIGSQLTLGESFTSGSLFSSLGFRGIQLETDDRMLPESQRGYAPAIRGVAATTAKVSVRQSGVQIYQTTVAPGAFVIDDLYPTSYQGDLVVEVLEADGRVSSFTVPFSAVSDSIRPGHSRVSFAAGQVRNIGNSDAAFTDLTYQAGLTNAITANTGVRISDGYQALLGGAVFASQLGALGVNATYSRADMWGKTLDGWRVGATYSRTFAPTSTTLALAGYRYSTQGYRDLSDVLGLREAEASNEVWLSSTYQQSNQLVVTVSQSLGEYGQVYFSGSTSTYHGGRGRDTQYQMAYSHSYNSISYNLSLSRQQTGRTPTGVVSESEVDNGRTQNVVMFSVSIPWGSGSRAPLISAGVTHETGGNTNYQAAMAGTLGENQSLSYSVNSAFNSGGEGVSLGANATKQLPIVTVGGSFSQGRGYTQGGASARGAAVLHSGGITFGPYLGDTFGLIEAEGVKGAEVMNGTGAKVNRFGYAIVPSLVPYRYNDISLNAKGIENASAELTENQQRVAPYAGSVVKVRFKTLEGYAVLIKVVDDQGGGLPLGSNVYDNNNTVIGLVGQGNQIYARVSELQGQLHAKWGDAASEQCTLSYDLRGQDIKLSLHRLELPCIKQ
ncbi:MULTISPECIES: fimbria/pilus outer membrane usher protein [unclassified Serratia (in: enterobacteria)]|uniref:fimbria/pilus outer membrane usher protein n=1 Tax=unclassified Serratia (in: enterobacteria) TaxID=2647522 RepID=UPI000503DC4D|nr:MULTISPECIES: fimbria/pilus outer membrane usher protein [unclassified Serratia (in: enterobacteria)]KFK96589.1 fimbrial assembly protein [Serratia sp. Ag2]KFK99791.1 fimbrial assembly protein [Serratia sp. Ag1]